MYLLFEIRHNIITQCLGNNMEMKKFNYLLEIGILRNSLQGLPFILGDWVSKRCPDALLAKTTGMPGFARKGYLVTLV